MDLDLAPEDRAFRDALRAWLAKHQPRRRSGRGSPGETVEGDRLAALKAWQRRLLEGGWLALGWPREYGGRAATLTFRSNG